MPGSVGISKTIVVQKRQFKKSVIQIYIGVVKLKFLPMSSSQQNQVLNEMHLFFTPKKIKVFVYFYYRLMEKPPQTNAIMRESTLGKSLISTLQEIEEEGTFQHLSDEDKNKLLHHVMESFDKKLQENLSQTSSTYTQQFKVSVKSIGSQKDHYQDPASKKSQPSSIVWYNNSNDEWKLQLKNVEFKPGSGEPIRTDRILVHAFPSKKDSKRVDDASQMEFGVE